MIMKNIMNRLEKEKWITIAALILISLACYAWGQVRAPKEEQEIIETVSVAPVIAPGARILKKERYEQTAGKEEKITADKTAAVFEVVRPGDEPGCVLSSYEEPGSAEAEEVEFEDKMAGPVLKEEISDRSQGTACESISCPADAEEKELLSREVETSGAELPEVADITSQTTTTAPEETAAGDPAAPPLYSVNGAVMPEEIQAHLYNTLAACGIGWFMPYAVMIAYQESRFNVAAENKNGLDKGLFQYRMTYWSYGDILSPYDQINIFVQQMAKRAASGCTVSEMISRHKQSDWGSYDQAYVDQVLQWGGVTVKIR